MSGCVVNICREELPLEEIAMRLPQALLDDIYLRYVKIVCNLDAMKKAHVLVDTMKELCNSGNVSNRVGYHKTPFQVPDSSIQVIIPTYNGQRDGVHVTDGTFVIRGGIVTSHVFDQQDKLIDSPESLKEFLDRPVFQFAFALFSCIRYKIYKKEHGWYEYSKQVASRFQTQKQLIAKLA